MHSTRYLRIYGVRHMVKLTNKKLSNFSRKIHVSALEFIANEDTSLQLTPTHAINSIEKKVFFSLVITKF